MLLNDLPDWQKLVRLVGEDQAAVLSAHYGGGRMFVPKLIGQHHPIAELVGVKAAALIAAEFGGARIEVPMMLGKRAQVIQLRAAGKPVAEICRRVGVSRRFVFYALAEERDVGEPAEPDLFDGR